MHAEFTERTGDALKKINDAEHLGLIFHWPE